MPLKASFGKTICILGPPPPSPALSGLRHPSSRLPAVPSRSTSGARSSPDEDEKVLSRTVSARGRTANHSDGFFCLETVAWDGLCVGSAAVRPSPAGSLTSLAPRSAAPSVQPCTGQPHHMLLSISRELFTSLLSWCSWHWLLELFLQWWYKTWRF